MSGPVPHPCQRRPHYDEPCECESRLALVVTHTRTSTPLGPDFCAECSEAISEWVTWPCEGEQWARQVPSGKAETRAWRRGWFRDVVALLHERPDLRGTFDVADVVDESVRWSA